MFANRSEAGRLLADKLLPLVGETPVVYGMPRGGLPVAVEIAARLKAPLDVILVRKIGAPFQAELAIGAIVDGQAPTLILHEDLVAELGVSQTYISQAREDALREIERRRQAYLKGRPPLSAAGRIAIVVDDGIATGASMEAALKAVKSQQSKRLLLAVPVAPTDTIERLRALADDVVCLEAHADFWAVGQFYYDFRQLSDEDVTRILEDYDKECAKQSVSGNTGPKENWERAE